MHMRSVMLLLKSLYDSSLIEFGRLFHCFPVREKNVRWCLVVRARGWEWWFAFLSDLLVSRSRECGIREVM